jgi:hypothetical protein
MIQRRYYKVAYSMLIKNVEPFFGGFRKNFAPSIQFNAQEFFEIKLGQINF